MEELVGKGTAREGRNSGDRSFKVFHPLNAKEHSTVCQDGMNCKVLAIYMQFLRSPSHEELVELLSKHPPTSTALKVGSV